MKSILCFSGSNSSTSINQQLVIAAANLVTGATTTVISITDFDLPIYSIDREQEGIPGDIYTLLEHIRTADGFIISCPEHNGTVPAVFKNVIDWLSRVEKKTFAGKPMLVMSTSPGPRGGQSNHEHLSEQLLPRWGANVCATFRMGNFYERFDTETQTVTDPECAAELKTAVDTLAATL